VSASGWPSDAPILDKGSDRSRDQAEPQSACSLSGTKMLAGCLRSPGSWYVHCGGRNDRALTEPFVSTLATLPFTALRVHRLEPKFEDCRSRRSLLRMQLFESDLLPLPCEREIFDVACTLDPVRCRCKPQGRSLQIELSESSAEVCSVGLRSLVFTCVAFRLVNSNLTFRVTHVGGLRVRESLLDHVAVDL
jgi:hypothetical protein